MKNVLKEYVKNGRIKEETVNDCYNLYPIIQHFISFSLNFLTNASSLYFSFLKAVFTKGRMEIRNIQMYENSLKKMFLVIKNIRY